MTHVRTRSGGAIRRRPLFMAGAAMASLTLVLTACSSGGSSATSASAESAPAASAPAASAPAESVDFASGAVRRPGVHLRLQHLL